MHKLSHNMPAQASAQRTLCCDSAGMLLPASASHLADTERLLWCLCAPFICGTAVP